MWVELDHDGRADPHAGCGNSVENRHEQGILRVTLVPASASSAVAAKAEELAAQAIAALNGVGVFCVELFETRGGDLLINEIAPRPHNSGHLTIEGAVTSQFEQQVRAVCGLGLGSTDLCAPGAAMVNLLGDLCAEGSPDWSQVLDEPAAHLHLYGTPAPRPGQKVGHITVAGRSPTAAVSKARQARNRLAPKRPPAPRAGAPATEST